MAVVQRARISKLLSSLEKEYPDHRTLLQFSTPFELLIAVILSAQTTDEQVNSVLPALFASYPDAAALARAKVRDVEKLVFSTGFYKNKAKNIIACAQSLLEKHSGKVPQSMEELITLPGVGRKTAGVVLYHIFGSPAIIVDTHFGRVCRRLGLSDETDPTRLEFAVRDIIPRDKWGMASMVINFHGRRVCRSRDPQCESCVLAKFCMHCGAAESIK